MKRYTKTKYDQNHSSICADLRKQGVEVVEILDPVDLLACLGSYVMFLEVKIEGSKARYTRKQLQFIAGTKMPIAIVKTAAEAMHYLKTHARLGQDQKDRLAGFLEVNKGDYFQPSVIEGILNGKFANY